MITFEVQLRERTFAAVFKLAESRGLSVVQMIEGAMFALSWEEPKTFFQREVTRMHAAGETVAWMASALAVPNNQIQTEMRKQGLRANKPNSVVTVYQRKANQ